MVVGLVFFPPSFSPSARPPVPAPFPGAKKKEQDGWISPVGLAALGGEKAFRFFLLLWLHLQTLFAGGGEKGEGGTSDKTLQQQMAQRRRNLMKSFWQLLGLFSESGK